MGAWMTSLETRAPLNLLIVATANKLWRQSHGRYPQPARTTGGSRTSCCLGQCNHQDKNSPTEVTTSKDERTVTTAYLKPD
jgi:hypothetical protein